jgi:hypothetical protein
MRLRAQNFLRRHFKLNRSAAIAEWQWLPIWFPMLCFFRFDNTLFKEALS